MRADRSVVVMSDRQLVGDAFRLALGAAAFVRVGPGAEAAEAVDACAELRPDAVLIDLPQLAGTALAARLAAAVDVPIVVLSPRRRARAETSDGARSGRIWTLPREAPLSRVSEVLAAACEAPAAARQPPG